MSKNWESRSAGIRAKLGHPVIDADGHLLELGPVFLDFLKQTGGSELTGLFLRSDLAANELLLGKGRWEVMSSAERRKAGLMPPAWWSFPARNTLDRATASLPRLLRARLDELGIDFSVLYPTMGLGFPGIADEELRRAACRAYNTYVAELYGECRDRMTPAAVIPLQTPKEAIEEIEYATGRLGLKAITIGLVRRAGQSPTGSRIDTLAFESDYDYDPVWAACVKHGVAAVSHATGRGWDTRRSTENNIYNHLGHFAAAGEALCRALFMGGVTRRFPTLNFGFLEGGAAWACHLYNGLVAHWEKRNPAALLEHLDPATIDQGLMLRLMKEHGHPRVMERLQDLAMQLQRPLRRPAELDEFAPCQIRKAEDIRDLFVPRFYFGCEADDSMNSLAFDTKVNRFGARLQAVLGSDIGHWDVTDMSLVVAEAYELVEQGLMMEEDFRDFVFVNPARLHAGMNPNFFRGTLVAEAVAKLQTPS